MKYISTIAYEKAIKYALTPRQIEILQVLYSFPNSSATASELASRLGYSSFQGANLHIGTIGKTIAKYLKFTPSTYTYNEKYLPAYFSVVGWEMNKNLRSALINLGYVPKKQLKSTEIDISERLSTEVPPYDEKKLYSEGKSMIVYVNKYERNQKARLKCIQYHGSNCKICGFSFGKKYGKIAKDYIQVHHIIPLSELHKSYKVDPKKDLIPVCSNCHSVIHLRNPCLSISEARKLIRKLM